MAQVLYLVFLYSWKVLEFFGSKRVGTLNCNVVDVLVADLPDLE